MPRIVFLQPDGACLQVDAPIGITLMEAARRHHVPGIVAQCGGACACATCHVYIDRSWLPKLQAAEDMEIGMLEMAWEPRDNSRLSCQIHITSALDGMSVALPVRQGQPDMR